MSQPLRVQKGTPNSSPTKSNGPARHLAELSPMAVRRNSPSFNQSTKLLDSPQIDTSPFASKFANFTSNSASTRSYWQGRESPVPRTNENRDPNEESPVASKRPSVENLKRANRVSKSNIFAIEAKREYDPMASAVVERPLAAGRPLASAMPLGLQARNSILDKKRQAENSKDTENDIVLSPGAHATNFQSPERHRSPLASPQPSPTKSAMSQNPRYSLYDPETSIWSELDDGEERKLPPGKGLHRHAKSVTFNASPPEVNEYEQDTPDPSVSAVSREGSYDEDEEEDQEYEEEERIRAESQDSFDEALEDTDKTPVVLPEDWRFMSPEVANTEAISNMDDPFGTDDANHQLALANAMMNMRSSPTRTDSLNSNGSRRPLPPLPPPSFPRERQGSQDSLDAVAERAATTPRHMPATPKAAAFSKDELRNIGSSRMSLEERLQLMSVQDQSPEQTPRKAHDEIRERRMRRKSGLHNSMSEHEIKIFEDEPEAEGERDAVGELADFQPIPRISRDSILRKVKSQKFDEHGSPEPESPQQEKLPELNPDEPITSYEETSSFIEGDDGAVIKSEEDEDAIDMYSLPLHEDSKAPQHSARPEAAQEDDAESQYSTNTDGDRKVSGQLDADDGPPTPRAEEAQKGDNSNRMSLPDFADSLNNDFGLSLSSYMTPSPNNSMTDNVNQGIQEADYETIEPQPQQQHRPATPELPRVPGYSEEELREPSTPESVIRRSLSIETFDEEQEEVPEPAATIKAPGSKMKTRPSLTPQDMHAMAETRRQVSGGHAVAPPVPEKHAGRPSMVEEVESFLEEDEAAEKQNDRQSKRRSSLVRLDVPVQDEEDELSFGLDKEFDRVIEAQKVAFEDLLMHSDFSNHEILEHHVKAADPCGICDLNTNKLSHKQKGYLMRQNTKVVVASSGANTTTTSDDSVADSRTKSASSEMPPPRGTRSAGNSPVKKPHQPSGAWTTHEWNGKVRRKSIRQSGGLPSELFMSGGVPPLPGMSSAVQGMESLDEADENDTENDGKERGRLFVRVVGVKDLNLPLPRNEKSYFALTLDNGLHCVTTSWMDLNKSAPIGQEFELVVLNDLEFQLTLQTKLEQPKPVVVRPESPSKQTGIKKPGFGRFFGSPKKKKEQELREEQERLARLRAEQARTPTAWDLLHNLVAKDGSFARSYVSLKEHENQAFGRPLTVDIPCFNEWASEESRSVTSGKSTSTVNSMQRRAPYKVGKLELQLLYVPKPKEARDDEMPKSMNACIREMQEAEKTSSQTHEGYLSQQGGDCPYWRRRFFRLAGSKLTAYHETTHQPRATINLAKAAKLIDDKSHLKQQSSNKGGGRRKSAFGSEEDGYMFLEEGFRVRFSNGETIDFYAENVKQKDEWMAVLSDVVGRDSKPSRGWTDVVLKREKAAKQLEKEQEKRKASAEAKARSSGAIVPGPRTSSRDGTTALAPMPTASVTGRRPVSQDSFASSSASVASSQSSRPSTARSQEKGMAAPPAVPAKDAPAAVGRRPVMDSAERRAKARSTYY